MEFAYTDKVQDLRTRLLAFMDAHIYPNEQAYHDWVHDPANLWKEWPGMEALKTKVFWASSVTCRRKSAYR